MTNEEEHPDFRARKYMDAAAELAENGNDQALTYATLAQAHATLAVFEALQEVRERLGPNQR